MTRFQELRILREKVLNGVACAHRDVSTEEATALVDALSAGYHAEGVAEGKEGMRALIKSKVVNVGFHLDRDPGPIVYVPCWILDNTPEPTGPVKRGEFKVCLDEDDYPSVLAPTKEEP